MLLTVQDMTGGGGHDNWHVESPASKLATKARGLWPVGVKM